MTIDTERLANEALQRVEYRVARSAGQHKRAMRKAFAELMSQYALPKFIPNPDGNVWFVGKESS